VGAFYAKRAADGGAAEAKSGAVTVVQRTSSDRRRSPHLHIVFLDGTYHEEGAELAWQQLGHLQSREVGEVLERALRRMARHLRHLGVLESDESGGESVHESVEPDDKLAASAVSGQVPPAGALDVTGREALLRYALRPPLAQERLVRKPDGLVRMPVYSPRPAPGDRGARRVRKPPSPAPRRRNRKTATPRSGRRGPTGSGQSC